MLLLFGGRIEIRIHHAPYTNKINHPVLCITFVAHPKRRSFPNLLERVQQDCKKETQAAPPNNPRDQSPSCLSEHVQEPCAFPN